MRFLRYEPIKTKLRERTLTEREALPYLAANVGLVAIALLMIASGEQDKWDELSALPSVFITVGGVLYAYRQNGGASGYDIVLKYLVLGFIVSVRTVLAVLVVSTLFLFSAFWIFPEYEGDSGPVGVIFWTCVELFVVERIGRHIRDTTGTYGGPSAFVP